MSYCGQTSPEEPPSIRNHIDMTFWMVCHWRFNCISLLFLDVESTSHLPRRLTHSIQEPNVARGYIKEHCFSSDGRIICSPFGNSARILGFSSECDELASCVHGTPSELCDLKTLISHKQPVLTCRFSPTHLLLSMGCLGGKVSFYQPKL